jgi:hypothetical protein
MHSDPIGEEAAGNRHAKVTAFVTGQDGPGEEALRVNDSNVSTKTIAQTLSNDRLSMIRKS